MLRDSMSARRLGKRAPADIDFTLRRVFGKSNFRPYQREIITAALDGELAIILSIFLLLVRSILRLGEVFLALQCSPIYY